MAIEIINKTGYGFPITRRVDSSADHSGLPNSCYFEQTDLGGLTRYKDVNGIVSDAFTSPVYNTSVITIAANSNILPEWNGKVVQLGATLTLTANSDLPPGFQCKFVTSDVYVITMATGTAPMVNTVGATSWGAAISSCEITVLGTGVALWSSDKLI
jgi:hypothetical protein